MFKRLRYIIMQALVLFGAFGVAAQVPMPDHVHIGSTKHYNVDQNPAPGSTYTWKIDGVIQVGFTTREIDITWNTAGKYLLEVQEQSANGCLGPVRSGEVFVNTLPGLTAVGINPATCGTDGSIHFAFTNVPDGTYTITYDQGSFRNVAAASGSATVVAAVGVYKNLTITIAGYTSSPGLDITMKAPETPPPPLVSVNKNVSCNGLCDGEITVTIPGDHLDYYSLSGGGTWSSTAFSAPFTITGLSPDSYSVIVKDANGCISAPSSIATISQPEVLTVATSGTYINSFGGNISTATATATGGTAPYTYLWSNGKTTATVTDLTAGVYTLKITDNFGCMTTKDFKFPVEIHLVIANPDYAKTSWVQDTDIDVLANDQSSAGFIQGTMQVIEQPKLGKTRVNATGSITYIPRDRRSGRDQFVYEVCDAANLCASATVTIDIYDSKIIIPSGFSPNGDGVNDRFVIGGLENYHQSQFYVYTRSGVPVYQSFDYQNDWDGITIKKAMTMLEIAPPGVYYYVLKLGETNRVVKGFIYIDY